MSLYCRGSKKHCGLNQKTYFGEITLGFLPFVQMDRPLEIPLDVWQPPVTRVIKNESTTGLK
jgi:hypothetical protein